MKHLITYPKNCPCKTINLQKSNETFDTVSFSQLKSWMEWLKKKFSSSSTSAMLQTPTNVYMWHFVFTYFNANCNGDLEWIIYLMLPRQSGRLHVFIITSSSICYCGLPCCVLCPQSGGELENDEGVATKLSKMVLTAVRLVNTSEKKDAFKRLTGMALCLLALAINGKYTPLRLHFIPDNKGAWRTRTLVVSHYGFCLFTFVSIDLFIVVGGGFTFSVFFSLCVCHNVL